MDRLASRLADTLPLQLPVLVVIVPASLAAAAVMTLLSPGLGIALAVAGTAIARQFSIRRVRAGLDPAVTQAPGWRLAIGAGGVGLVAYAAAAGLGFTRFGGIEQLLVPVSCLLAAAWLISIATEPAEPR